MIVLFETERFSDPIINDNLLDVLFAIKADIIKRTLPVLDEIDSQGGEIVIVFKPDVGGFRMISMTPELMWKVNEYIKDILFENYVMRIKSAKEN